MFNVMPLGLKALPITEYRLMQRYYVAYREALETAADDTDSLDGMAFE